MNKYNINDEIIIYPNLLGWNKIIEIVEKEYNLSNEKAIEFIEKRKHNGGFTEQLHEIISTYHEMFFNGTPYFVNAIIDLCGNVEVDDQNPTIFIINQLDLFSIIFKDIKFKYEYRLSSGTHIVEVISSDKTTNWTYLEAENNFDFEFNKLFPREELMFVDEESLTKIINPIYISK